MQFLSALLLLLTPVTLGAPLAVPETSPFELETRQSNCLTTCGSVCYTSAKVTAARNSGYNYIQQGGTAGGSSYPHVYNNYEGFDFLVEGPYYEFPILSSGQTYSGGSPGPDRVVFNSAGQRAGEITHTGADGNAFVGCTGTDT